MKPRVKLVEPYRTVRSHTWKRERCEAEVTDFTKQWRTRSRRKDMNCERTVVYEINGKRLCGLHAGREALAILLKEAEGRDG